MNPKFVRVPKDTGGPAFAKPATVGRSYEDNEVGSDGMTLRDYFAGQVVGSVRGASVIDADGFAEHAYAIADAMLKVREKTRYDLVPAPEESDEEGIAW